MPVIETTPNACHSWFGLFQRLVVQRLLEAEEGLAKGEPARRPR
jgi:hypothetical protein